jgi:hypothetical protein
VQEVVGKAMAILMCIIIESIKGYKRMNFLTPLLKSISSPDVSDLEHYSPTIGTEFRVLLEGIFAPSGEEGGEVFSFEVCSSEWIKKQASKGIVIGRHLIIVDEFNFANLKAFIQKIASGCVGENWNEVALKLSRYGHWEFEDYKP